MQRIDRRGTANWQRKDHLFLSAQWRLGIPFPIQANLWLLGKFIQTCVYRISWNHGCRLGRVTTTAKLHLDAVDLAEPINSGASNSVGHTTRATHSQASRYA